MYQTLNNIFIVGTCERKLKVTSQALWTWEFIFTKKWIFHKRKIAVFSFYTYEICFNLTRNVMFCDKSISQKRNWKKKRKKSSNS